MSAATAESEAKAKDVATSCDLLKRLILAFESQANLRHYEQHEKFGYGFEKCPNARCVENRELLAEYKRRLTVGESGSK